MERKLCERAFPGRVRSSTRRAPVASSGHERYVCMVEKVVMIFLLSFAGTALTEQSIQSYPYTILTNRKLQKRAEPDTWLRLNPFEFLSGSNRESFAFGDAAGSGFDRHRGIGAHRTGVDREGPRQAAGRNGDAADSGMSHGRIGAGEADGDAAWPCWSL